MEPRRGSSRILGLCQQVALRVQETPGLDATTFAAPEAAPAAIWVASTTRDPALRAEASSWLAAGGDYRALVGLCVRAALALDGETWATGLRFAPLYREKVRGELESMLALCPTVLVLPTAEELTPWDMIALRAFPVHPLGLVNGPAWTDGAMAPPSEFFFHDLDHARFKVREDLLALGIPIPDAYQNGTTLDPVTGRHRAILSFARGRLGRELWARADARVALADRLFAHLGELGEGPLARAAELLLFEIVHEKSFPLELDVLRRELGNPAHLVKLQGKVDRRFFPTAPAGDVMEALPLARATLTEVLS